jgi:hypothetical protein
LNSNQKNTISLGVCLFSALQISHIRTAHVGYQAPQGEPADRAAVAAYVATLSADLALLARQTGFETLGYLLEMVRLEAEQVSRHGPNRRR